MTKEDQALYIKILASNTLSFQEALKGAPPYPFCREPIKCAGKGYCQRDIACNN